MNNSKRMDQKFTELERRALDAQQQLLDMNSVYDSKLDTSAANHMASNDISKSLNSSTIRENKRPSTNQVGFLSDATDMPGAAPIKNTLRSSKDFPFTYGAQREKKFDRVNTRYKY